MYTMGFSGGCDGKEYACNAGDLGSVLGWDDPLEKRMVTHPSILTWRVPWTEKPGGQSMGVTKSDTTEQLSHVHYIKETIRNNFASI